MTDQKTDLCKLKELIVHPRIGEILIQHKKINIEQLTSSLEEQKKKKDSTPIGRILIDKGYVTENDLIELLSIQKNIAKLLEESYIELEKLESENSEN